MASLGAHIIIAGQHEWEGVSAVKRICEENREAKVEFEQLDLVSLQSVRQFIQTFKRRGLLLHILVNNVFFLYPQSLSQGASMVLYTALSPSLEWGRGGYWSNGRTDITSTNTYNPQLQLGLWDCSCRLVGLQDQHQP
ncbi:short-chain dehydrogenase TIC 32 A, chloroplastic-like isoform X3 [Coregonus clupeaformis]|nr:short-chain dehydrogenase TIC 32 A, chloroplastic-like isoform X3 [Coregonus clupeaformis]